MSRIYLTGLLLMAMLMSCNKGPQDQGLNLTATIADYNLNCSTCILQITDDTSLLSGELGKSPGNYYEAINLSKDNFKIGQTLKLRVRKADPAELQACITQYPSPSYQVVFVTEFESFGKLTLNDTLRISDGDCLSNSGENISLCFESVVGDSRCPTGVECIWAGNATARFKFSKSNDLPVFFDLNTNGQFTADTVIKGYKFTLIGLSPYPSYGNQINPKDYKADILIAKE